MKDYELLPEEPIIGETYKVFDAIDSMITKCVESDVCTDCIFALNRDCGVVSCSSYLRHDESNVKFIEVFEELTPDSECPCGSGRKYKSCCLNACRPL